MDIRLEKLVMSVQVQRLSDASVFFTLASNIVKGFSLTKHGLHQKLIFSPQSSSTSASMSGIFPLIQRQFLPGSQIIHIPLAKNSRSPQNSFTSMATILETE
jgi:hypothetical protein